MCRFIAYQGEPILLEALVSLPSHSLLRQAAHARQALTRLNADGFGLGWYVAGGLPETYHNEQPAWLDRDLPAICERIRSGHFFAHVRAATGTAVNQVNCHPFANGRWMFMHNGQVGNWPALRKQAEAALPARLRSFRRGTTDSEAMFLSAIADGLEQDPIKAVEKTLARFRSFGGGASRPEPLRFAAALSDGQTIWAFRWASDLNPPTLYYRRRRGGIAIASEPTDRGMPDWKEIPAGSCLVVRMGRPLRAVPLDV